VCLSFGERGESQWAWKKGDVSLEDVKRQRSDDAQRAAEILGAENSIRCALPRSNPSR
jgi:4-oxalomesaconate hydratase